MSPSPVMPTALSSSYRARVVAHTDAISSSTVVCSQVTSIPVVIMFLKFEGRAL